MITRINTVAFYVDDQQRSLEFWTEKMGFQVCRKEQMGPSFLVGGGAEEGSDRLGAVPRVDDGQLGRAKTIHCLRLR